MTQENRMYLLIHTMTIADYDFVIQAQFFHTFFDGLARPSDARLIGRRVSVRLHPARRRSRQKVALQWLEAPSLRTIMKRNSAVVKHHLRTVHIGPEFQKSGQNPQNHDSCLGQQAVNAPKSLHSNPQSPEKDDSLNEDNGVPDTFRNNQLTTFSTPNETVHWLTANRFEKYLDMFSRFSGSDMLRMSREDLIQICGSADGIRLHNALNLKAILKLYICRENASIFNAIFLNSHSHMELLQKLCSMSAINRDQVKAVYIEGPHSIHIQLSDDVLRHVEQETMFTLNVIQENGVHVLLLKRKAKQ